MKKVSVIVPVYNTEKWVEECIRSIQNGGYDNLEIIVVDDGSHDNSGVIINQLFENDPRIMYVHKKNGGLPAARESGLKVSTGDYILFVDSDDCLKENAIKIMVDHAVKTDADMVFSDYLLLYHSSPSAILNMNPKEVKITTGVSYLRNRIECYACMKLFKRELLDGVVQQKSSVCEDLFFMVQVLVRCKKIEYVNLPLYVYRQTENSIMRASRERTVGEWLKHAIQMRELLPTLMMPDDLKDLFYYENIHTIYRFLKEGNRRDKNYMSLLKELVNSTYKDINFRTINSFHRLKLILFLTVIHFIYGK